MSKQKTPVETRMIESAVGLFWGSIGVCFIKAAIPHFKKALR